MPTRPSEAPPWHALARWTVLLLGWVWLGQQGQRLGWSLASGVLPVALWWAARMVLATRTVRTPWLGTLTAAGALLVGQSAHGMASLLALLGLSVVWAAWLVQLEQSIPQGHCRVRWRGAAPLAAGLLTALCTTDLLPGQATAWMGGPVLGIACLCARPFVPASRRDGGAAQAAARAGAALSSPAAAAMGLMMGTLWLSNAWCSAAGWSQQAMVLLHLALMACLPALTAGLRPARTAQASLVLVSLGTALLAVPATPMAPAYGIAGMGLLAAAWALRPTGNFPPQGPGAVWLALTGPALLLAVGWHSPTAGPWAQQWAYAAIGVTAAGLLLWSWLRPVHGARVLTPRSPSV